MIKDTQPTTSSTSPETLVESPATPKKSNKLTRKEWILLGTLAMMQFTHIVDFMIIMPLGAQFMEIFDISPKQFSIIVSSYAGTAFAVGLFGALFIDRFDRKKALLGVYIGFTLGTFACAVAPGYVFFLAARSLTGAFGGILAALVLSIVGDAIPLARRGQAMGIVMIAFSAASVVGVPAGLYLAAEFSWHMPFLVIGSLAAVISVVVFFVIPSMRKHLVEKNQRPKPLTVFSNILQDSNQLLALLFNVILMLGHFTIIPFIAPYMQLNIGFTDYEITYIYMVGGVLTVFLLPLFGRLADRFGHARVFTFASLGALASIFVITNLPPVSIVLALVATSSFFVVASGRNVPALTMITSVVKPEHRGGFMSVRTSINSASMGLASLISGFIVTENASGTLENYAWVGYFAILMSAIAIVFAWRLKAVD